MPAMKEDNKQWSVGIPGIVSDAVVCRYFFEGRNRLMLSKTRDDHRLADAKKRKRKEEER